MAKITFQTVDSEDKIISVKEGQTILRAARQGRVDLRHKCGGKASCTTCKVIIEDQSGISLVTEKEARKLGDENIAKGLRLSCQTQILQEVVVTRSEEHTSELQSRGHLVCRLLLEKKNK